MPSTTTYPHNAAAWALRAKSRPLVVSSASYSAPPAGHVAIKVETVAINPIDWIMQDQDIFGARYPAIFGSDLAGEIVQVGEGVVGLQVGQKVIAHANGLTANNSSHGAFQKYALVPQLSTASIPSSLPTTQAVVLPLSISTAAAGLYQPHYLALPFPNATTPNEKFSRTVLIWGGSSSVGSTAIQLASASGARVFTTCSARNSSYCRRLGADKVFDYHARDVEDSIAAALKGTTLAGVYHAAGDDSAVYACARIAERSEGKAIVVTVRRVPRDTPERGRLPNTVRVKAISSSDIFREGNEVGKRIWRDYVPAALAKGLLVPAPEPMVVGLGLRSVQHGLDVQKKGVSAAKVVVDKIDQDASREAEATRVRTPMPTSWLP